MKQSPGTVVGAVLADVLGRFLSLLIFGPRPVQHPSARAAYGIGSRVTHYLVDDLNPTGYAQVVEEVLSGTVEREYTYGLQRINENQIISSTWTPSFYGYDGAGTVRQLTNTAGAVTDTNEYDAFGNLINFTGTTPNVYMYRAEQYDSDLGLYYLRARYYNPLTGRFMSRDPESGTPRDPASLHKYLYANGDPVNLMDPSGRDAGVELSLILTTIRTVTVPGLIAAAGEYVTLQAIPWIVSTEILAGQAAAAAEALAVFLADAAASHHAKGIAKLYVCYELGTLFVDLNLDLDSATIPGKDAENYKRIADAALIYACSDYLLK